MSAIASGGHLVELLERLAEVEASQKKLVADVFAKHSEQAGVFNKLVADFRTSWNLFSESSKSTLKQCADAVKGVAEERKLLEEARTKVDEMSGKIIEGVAAAITKASEDAVEKQLKHVEERLVEKAVKDDLFYSTLPPESMKELKDIVKKGYEEAEAGRLEVLTEAMARGFRGSAGPSTRSRQEEGVAGVRSGVEPRVHERSVPPSSVGGHGLGKKGGKGVVGGEKSGALIESVASVGIGAVGKRGASTPSGGAAGKGAGETRGAPSQVVVAVGLLSKTKADSAAQLGIVGPHVEPVGKRVSSSTAPVAPVAAPVLGDVRLSEPASPPPGPRDSPSASKKRQAEKAKKARVLRYAAPPPPDAEGKVRGAIAPFKGPAMWIRSGKPVSEQTVGGRKRFLGTFETVEDQKFCTAICWRVYFPDVKLDEYEGFTADDVKEWKQYLNVAASLPTGVWSVAQEQGQCRLDE
ncbi:unnamed protein product [Closterium sp. Naga37s-1]|nr:unnamed protein product [Closterium sp. Naga37s-1]